MKNQYQLRGRIWIENGNNAFLGSGKAELLRKTVEFGSLRRASKELNISYRQAWYSLNQLNRMAESPVILFQRGGSRGGSALITEHGRSILDQFEKLQQDFKKFLEDQNEILVT